MQLLDGKKISKEIKEKIKNTIDELIKDKKRIPKLVVIIVGNDYASHVYINSKLKACENVGIIGKVIAFPTSISESEIITTINNFNQDKTVDGILVQLPLAKNLNEHKILNSISVDKDVDGLTSTTLGKILQGDTNTIIPCTVKGIIALLTSYNIKIDEQDITIINNSNIIGKPLAMLLNNLGATVTIAHKKTKNLNFYLKNSDIIITAAGVYNLFTSQDIKDNATIIDVAINKKGKKVVGDVNFEEMKTQAKSISPVPGGVGPMTIAMLLENLMILYKKNSNKF